MGKKLSIRESAFNVISEKKTKEAAILCVEECIWSLSSFSENNKLTLTANANAYQLKHWINVLIYIKENNFFYNGKTVISFGENKK